eukprot:scaffold4025_cov55-Phaeocystis_antarctica.AAC.2
MNGQGGHFEPKQPKPTDNVCNQLDSPHRIRGLASATLTPIQTEFSRHPRVGRTLNHSAVRPRGSAIVKPLVTQSLNPAHTQGLRC